MKEVFFVKSENRSKAEELIKKDDLISRGSITIKEAKSMGTDKEGYFIILDTSDEGIKKAEDLLKDIAEKYEKRDEILSKIKEQEDSAIEGLGSILGG